jgi:hypothetical protein
MGSYLLAITTKGTNIRLDPLQSSDLITKSQVGYILSSSLRALWELLGDVSAVSPERPLKRDHTPKSPRR